MNDSTQGPQGKAKESSSANEFGGPIGTFATTIALPVVVLFLLHWTKVGYLDLQVSIDQLLLRDDTSLATLTICTVGLIGWFFLLVALWKILPGPTVSGAPIHGDKKHILKYKLNGHLTFWVVVGAVLGLQYTTPIITLNHYLYRYYVPLAVCDILLCCALSLYMYLSSFVPSAQKILAKGGNSGNHVYDFFMGRELNPRWGGAKGMESGSEHFDWKFFCELRPGLIGWMLLNWACLQEQYQVHGYVSGSMWLINIFQAIYVWDALYQERAILTTMDITTDGFGFMLVFGDLAWVPFTYSVPAKYLVHHDPQLSNLWLLAVIGVYAFGYYIFRSANGQKDLFRRNPNDPRVAHLSYLPTQRGTRLLTSGWWGRARKINYTGDYLMGITYCLLCGVDSIVPYYYAVYFCILLIHRSWRDDEMCHQKYGADWLEYKKQVPYLFVPGIV